MSVSGRHRGNSAATHYPGRHVARQDESLSPPPPRPLHASRNFDDDSPLKNRLDAIDEVSPLRRQMQHRTPVGSNVTAAEAVATALNIQQSIRLRKSEDMPEQSQHTDAPEMSVTLSSTSTEAFSGRGRPDLSTIAESPNELVPERTPERSLPPFVDESPGPETFEQLESLCLARKLSSSATGTTTSLHNGPSFSGSFGLSSSSQSSSSRRGQLRKPQKTIQLQPLQVGMPVSFYLDGRPQPYVGWLRAISANGTYSVDLVGGGRMKGLESVTPCLEEEVKKAEKLKRPLDCSEDPYARYDTRNKEERLCLSPGRDFAVGSPVSFTLEKHQCNHTIKVAYPERLYGHVQRICSDGSYVIELPGGARRTNVFHLSACLERDVEKFGNLKQSQRLITRKSEWADFSTRNAPVWGGGSGYSGGYRERSPPRSSRSVLSISRSSSMLSLQNSSSMLGLGSPAEGKRSLSPQLSRLCRDQSWAEDLQPGSPVYFSLEGDPEPHCGWILAIDHDGSFTVSVVGGRRIVGLREVVPCSAEDIEKRQRAKRGMITRTNAWDEFSTRNRPPSRSPSPIPRLRGVAINLPPRSSTQMPL